MRVYNIKILNLSDPVLQLIKTKLVIKNKLEDLLGELKIRLVQIILILEKKKIDYHKSMRDFSFQS